ncbi:hypothetical protein ABL840_19025 [Variovorax sp. NFACC27]|jgi:hypothetical protein|nr:hypothetical protein [Variovorax paradoxus]SEF34684.1 hypothetical protein SAMN03159371_07196 [Variovorax sp. NFACC28]SEG97673.1 hypothetical protein SAMN03159365_06970 [Variovorax sp. NFACC29]SFD99433.1 hypothetical protein SAMN03159379_06991 [Variovorax sp. NFACC26]SFH25177.1 hypothetical protein SAMN03159447_07466 [Variovorax sp. NFACC27]
MGCSISRKEGSQGSRIGLRAATVMALALSLAPMLAAGQDPDMRWSQDPATGCRFVAPASLGAAPTYWSGSCQSGKASGIGMLRTRVGANAGYAFYGELRDGMPVIGAVDLEGGFRVGRFVAGDIGTRDTEWQERHDGFEAALRAARAVSAHYAGQKNTASARHYSAVAKKLETQLEGD